MEVHTVQQAVHPATTVFMYPKPPEFEEHDRKYYNCCCHVRNGALIVAFIGVIVTLAQAIWTIINISMVVKNGQQINGVSTAFSFIVIFLMFLINVLVIFGVQKERSGFLLPYLIVTVFQMVAIIIGIILVVVSLAMGKALFQMAKDAGTASSTWTSTDATMQQEGQQMIAMLGASFSVAMGVVLGVLLVLLLFTIWFFVIVKRARRFLLDKHLHECVAMHFKNRVAVAPESGHHDMIKD